MSSVDRQEKVYSHLEMVRMSIDKAHPKYLNKSVRELIEVVGWLADEVFLVLKPRISTNKEPEHRSFKTDIRRTIYGVRNNFKVITTFIKRGHPEGYYETLVVGHPIAVEGGPWRAISVSTAEYLHNDVSDILKDPELERKGHITPNTPNTISLKLWEAPQ